MKIFKCKDNPKDWKGQHVLHCCHSLNRRSKIYYIMYCDILKKMPDGRLKIKVYGQRYTSVETDRIRYVPEFRVEEASKMLKSDDNLKI